MHVASAAVGGGDPGDRRAHHFARRRAGWRARRPRAGDRQKRHGADALAGTEGHARPDSPSRTVESTSAPWVTSGSSPASWTTPAGAVLAPPLDGKRERRALAAREGDGDGIRERAREQRLVGGRGGGGRARAGGSAAAELLPLVGGHDR